MERRARVIVFWGPGMAQNINDIRNSYVHCNCIRHSQATIPPMPVIPPMPINSPPTPFEHIFAGYFDYGGRHFLVMRDEFSVLANVFGTSLGSSIADAAALVSL